MEEKPFEYTLSSLTAYGFSGQKYVTESFTPVVPELESGDSFQITSSDESAVAYDSHNNTVVVTRDSTEDKIVTVTLDVTKIEGDDVSKEFKLYVPSESVDALYEGFDYPEQKGASISQAEDWKFDNEVSDTSTTGLTAKVQPSPDDEGDLAMNLHVYRSYSKNQYPTFQGTADVKGDAIIQANFKFDETATNRYIWYIYGAEKTSSGETSTTLMQLIIDRGNNQITCQSNGVDGVLVSSTALPTNEWVNLKIVIHSTENTFDMYQDTVKLNANPIQLANVVSGGTVTRISSMNFGGVRWDGNAGDMYLDDIVVRYNPADIFGIEASMLNIPSTLIYDYALPTTGIYDGTTISWSSDNEAVLSSTGVVNRNVGFGSTTVKLTATIKSGDDSFDKDFYVDVVNAPYYTIDSLVFGTEGGDVSYSPVANGTIDSMYVTKYSTDAEDNAAAYVAIYDADDKLVSASKVADVSETGEIELDIALPNSEGMYAKAFIWNSETLEPLAYGYSTKIADDATVYSIGDSTMQSYGTISARQSDNGMTGWAQLLPLAVKDDSISLNNAAVAGTSTLSFYNLGYIHPIYDSIKPGDYLIIQFGHNDEKPWMSQDAAKNYSPLEAAHQLLPNATEVPDWATSRKSYEQWLRDYAAAARMKGAQVVFATSIYRHAFNGEEAADSHYGYPEAMIDTAAETGTPLLDLHARTGEMLNSLGEANSLKYYMASTGSSDHTHLTYDGAVEVSNMALNELRRIGHPLQDAFTTVPER